MAKAILSVLRPDILSVAGSLQLCAGQEAGCEAAVHAMRSIFAAEECNAVLLVDANNAFNTLNRQTALHNIRALCPTFASVLINTYRAHVNLIVAGGERLLSKEGTTQGDPLAMVMYALSIKPLITQLDGFARQVWYADDATGAGSFDQVRAWWDEIITHGPVYGYHANASKTWLIVKEGDFDRATEIFDGAGVQITARGKRHLGAALGDSSFVEEFVGEKVKEWVEQIHRLSSIASTQPHAAYAGFVHGLVGRWTYLLRTVPDIGPLLLPLEEAIHQKFLPALTGRPPCSPEERELLSLPVRFGGLGIIDPSTTANTEFQISELVSAPLVALIVLQENVYSVDQHELRKIKADARAAKLKNKEERIKELRKAFKAPQQRAIDLAMEKGASTWLSVLPIEEHGFSLHKGAFRDALCLRYAWQIPRVPQKCVCDRKFDVNHAMICPRGGFPTLRHNEVRDLTADLLTEVCHDVEIEPQLQELTGEHFSLRTANMEDGARLDVKARGFWENRLQCAFFDVRVFYPNAQSNQSSSSLSSAYRKHEMEKKRAYGQRVREVEHGSFTPLVLSSTGGMGREAYSCYKRIASLIAQKRNTQYSQVMNWIRCRLSFALL